MLTSRYCRCSRSSKIRQPEHPHPLPQTERVCECQKVRGPARRKRRTGATAGLPGSAVFGGIGTVNKPQAAPTIYTLYAEPELDPHVEAYRDPNVEMERGSEMVEYGRSLPFLMSPFFKGGFGGFSRASMPGCVPCQFE